MKRREGLRSLLRRIFRDPRTEVEEELSFHLEQRVRDYMAHGLDETSARRAARERLGDLDPVRSECADLLETERRVMRLRDGLEDVRRDVAFGLRSAARSPLFTVVAVLTLGLGIGVNAAVLGVVKSVLVDALPYEDGGRLVRLYGRRSEESDGRTPLSAGVVTDIAARQRSFDRLAAFLPATWDVIYRTDEGPRVLAGAYVGPEFLATLGVRPVLGRSPTAAEIESDAFVVMLSWDVWQREFGGERSVIGRSVRVDADTWEIVGVLPEDFMAPMGPASFWFGLDVARAGIAARARTLRTLGVVARLRPGVTLAAARRDVSGIAAALAREHPDTDGGTTMTVMSLHRAMAGDTRAPLLALMGSAALVLLITCANLAGALLSRTITRRKEFAVRAALGAGRGRLVRQLLTESMLLGLAGAVAGLGLAGLALSGLRHLALPALPSYADLSLDRGAMLVMAVVALCTGLVIGVGPALSARRSGARGIVRDSTRTGNEARGSGRLRGLLVGVQVALCLSLLAGAGLLGRSLVAMMTAPLGFDPEGVLTVSVKGPLPAPDALRRQFFDRLEERVRSLPGVRGVASTNALPAGAMRRAPLAILGVTRPAADGAPFIPFSTVSDDYFRTMRIPLVGGRTFGPQDRDDTPPAIVISEGMARRFWPDGGALGARIRLGPETTGPWAEVVGVVGDVRNDPAVAAAEPMAYLSSRQSLLRSSRTYLVRTNGDPLAFARAFRDELGALDATVPMDDVGTLHGDVALSLDKRKIPALLMTAFAALALLLATVGVYAMFSNMATARQREFGVRLALGSEPVAIAGLVLRQGAVWMIAGLACGAAGAVIVGHALRGLLFGVSALDPIALGLATATLLAAGLVALMIPVRRLTRVDPRSILS